MEARHNAPMNAPYRRVLRVTGASVLLECGHALAVGPRLTEATALACLECLDDDATNREVIREIDEMLTRHRPI